MLASPESRRGVPQERALKYGREMERRIFSVEINLWHLFSKYVLDSHSLWIKNQDTAWPKVFQSNHSHHVEWSWPAFWLADPATLPFTHVRLMTEERTLEKVFFQPWNVALRCFWVSYEDIIHLDSMAVKVSGRSWSPAVFGMIHWTGLRSPLGTHTQAPFTHTSGQFCFSSQPSVVGSVGGSWRASPRRDRERERNVHMERGNVGNCSTASTECKCLRDSWTFYGFG